MEPSRILVMCISTSECSAQGQVFHCKLRHQGCSSAQRQVFNCKLRNQGCSFTGMKTVATIPVLQCEKEEKYICYLPSISKMLNGEPQNSPSKVTKPVHQQKKERERNTRGPAHNLTHRNITPFWWKNKYMSNIVVPGPCTIYFKWVLCLPSPW